MFLLFEITLLWIFHLFNKVCFKDEIASVCTNEETAVILLLLLLLKILCCFVVVVCCCTHIAWLVTGTFASKGGIVVFLFWLL